MNTLMRKFRNSIYYKRLFINHNVVMIYLSGSRLSGITDDISDFDIIIIVDEDVNIHDHINEYVMYKDKVKIHWYYVPFNKFEYFSTYGQQLNIIGGILFRNINDEYILYKNNKYITEINSLIERKNIISKNSSISLYNLLESLVDSIIDDNYISEKNYTKMIYQLCLSSYYLRDEKPDIEFLKSIKRIRWQPVSDEYKKLAIERLKILKKEIKEG